MEKVIFNLDPSALWFTMHSQEQLHEQSWRNSTGSSQARVAGVLHADFTARATYLSHNSHLVEHWWANWPPPPPALCGQSTQEWSLPNSSEARAGVAFLAGKSWPGFSWRKCSHGLGSKGIAPRFSSLQPVPGGCCHPAQHLPRHFAGFWQRTEETLHIFFNIFYGILLHCILFCLFLFS